MIAEHVAAYAAAWRDASKGKGRAMSWRAIARMLGLMGVGSFSPGELEAAAVAWSVAHVEPAALRLLGRARRPSR